MLHGVTMNLDWGSKMAESFVSHVYVLKKLQNNIVRLMLINLGDCGYSIQRTVLVNGRTQQYKNKKIWCSLFQVKEELERLIFEYEEKGFELRNEIKLLPSNDTLNCSYCATTTAAPSDTGIPVKSTDIPVHIDVGFDHIKISDLRYNTELDSDSLVQYCSSYRKSIAFLPFTMVAILSGNVIKIFSLKFNSFPMPGDPFKYICKLGVKASNDFSICDARALSQDYIQTDIIAVFSQTGGVCSIQFHFCVNWIKMTLFAQLNPTTGKLMLYAMKDGHYHHIYHLNSSLLSHNQNAEFMMKIDGTPHAFVDAHFIQRLSYNESVSEI